MTTTSKDVQRRSAAAALKAERAQDKVAAMQEYEAEARALRAKTERLRALRLAREAETMQATSTQQPATTATPDPTMQEPRKKKTAKRLSALIPARGTTPTH